MIRKGYIAVLFAAIAVTGATVTAFACGDDKATSATNASYVKSAVAADHCAGKTAKNTAVTADVAADHCAGKSAKNTAVTANVAAEHCARNSAAMAGSSSCCKMKGAKATATTAANTKAITAVAAGSSCSSSKGATAGFDAVVTGGGAACGTKHTGAMTGNMNHNCDACADMAMCESELKTAGSQYQVVPLKNGVMYVYTATDARNVRSVQSAIARRTDRINSLVSVQNAKLCPDCKRMRGAMASGKLTREVVNIEGGSISLVTSSDPTMVTRLYAMAGLSGQKVVKS